MECYTKRVGKKRNSLSVEFFFSPPQQPLLFEMKYFVLPVLSVSEELFLFVLVSFCFFPQVSMRIDMDRTGRYDKIREVYKESMKGGSVEIFDCRWNGKKMMKV